MSSHRRLGPSFFGFLALLVLWQWRPKRRRLTQGVRVAAQAAVITRKITKRDARAACAKDFNNLAQEVGVNFWISVRLPSSAAVERLARILEGRELDPEQTQRFQAAAKTWTDKGGVFSAPLLDTSTPPGTASRSGPR